MGKVNKMSVYDVLNKRLDEVQPNKDKGKDSVTRIADALERIAESLENIDENIEILQKRGF